MSEGLHEPAESLDAETIDRHRAIVSLMEELEAVDWYDQRVVATADARLAEVLAHNRDEEKEHAAMTLEWLRRRDPVLDEQLRAYLFTDGDIVAVEEEDHGEPRTELAASDEDASEPEPGAGDLRIRSLREN